MSKSSRRHMMMQQGGEIYPGEFYEYLISGATTVLLNELDYDIDFFEAKIAIAEYVAANRSVTGFTIDAYIGLFAPLLFTGANQSSCGIRYRSGLDIYPVTGVNMFDFHIFTFDNDHISIDDYYSINTGSNIVDRRNQCLVGNKSKTQYILMKSLGNRVYYFLPYLLEGVCGLIDIISNTFIPFGASSYVGGENYGRTPPIY